MYLRRLDDALNFHTTTNMAQTRALECASPTSRRHVVLADVLAGAAKSGHVVAAKEALEELSDVNTPVRGYTALGGPQYMVTQMLHLASSHTRRPI